MEFYKLSKSGGKRVTEFDSDFIISRIVRTEKQVHVGCMFLDENGVIGYHQASIPQLLLILSGKGYVCDGQKEYVEVEAGDAVFWDKGEWHETKSDVGMTALVIESAEMDPSQFMLSKVNK